MVKFSTNIVAWGMSGPMERRGGCTRRCLKEREVTGFVLARSFHSPSWSPLACRTDDLRVMVSATDWFTRARIIARAIPRNASSTAVPRLKPAQRIIVIAIVSGAPVYRHATEITGMSQAG